MPSLSNASLFTYNGPPEYASLLEPPYGDDEARREGKYPPARFPALNALSGYALTGPPGAPGLTNPLHPAMARIDMQIRVEGATEAHFRRFGEGPPTASSRALVARPLLRGMLDPKLELALVAPVAMTRFDAERFRFSSRALLIKMSPDLQRVRWSAKAYGGGAHDAVVAAAKGTPRALR